MKIAIVIGTRPEIIKMAPVIDEIQKRSIDFILIHTGQHYDHEMSDQFFLDLELPKPHYNIGVGSASHAEMTADMMMGIEKVLLENNIDIVLVQGDTNAVLAGALVASKLHIPVGHVEAGLRSFDKTMPEEINRMVADVCSKLFFVPTEESAVNLVVEGVNPKNIIITGNTVVDACLRNLKIADKTSDILSKFDVNEKILTLTMHRAENVDNEERLTNIVESLIELDEFNIVFPVHPRTLKNLERFGLYAKLVEKEHINIIKPVGYLDFLLLLSKSFLIMTDSGGLQEEAITLNVPCITLRFNTERPETVTAGGNILVGSDKEKILETVRLILDDNSTREMMKKAINPYGDGKSSERILDSIQKNHDEDKLQIKPPEDVMRSFTREMAFLEDEITVSKFEEINNALVRVVYSEGRAEFPHQNLELNGKFVLFDKLT
ncbi:non-hydrolyzing UDP-N-acetylglucosamine 2-epimerase [Methanobacterium alcaliphilum]|uniref:non-hydrolyzing UDP-N-acetylglucosamine 2-epimerase n=1 Tax=Methanobacterium alcaliphilum TaxID=392018 RepID=UPI00200B973F|nr:UDP-N-acetylglucosamine 2-epimerase (non-hydrolyzing) [Methanobacterium alcaliphilum]MCK9150904.1 UDP-N-acetylglucosamine 2-epimerase (non-hydrolyzing) [Methanobacterium alcaliphilum]